MLRRVTRISSDLRWQDLCGDDPDIGGEAEVEEDEVENEDQQRQPPDVVCVARAGDFEN